MRNQKKSHDLTRQNEVNVKKPQKHDANLQKNSTLYFQVGLILCLLFSYGMLEMNFETKSLEVAIVDYDDPEDFMIDFNPVIEKKIVKQKVAKKKPVKLIDRYDTTPDDTPDKDLDEVILEPVTDDPQPVKVEDVIDVKPPVPPVVIPVDFVEVVPVFPGCEGASTNAERKACMSKKIARHIQKKFDTDIAGELGLDGIQKIHVMFKIDQNGNIIDVQARSPYKQLKNEAEDVIGKLPQMTPGKQHDKNVSVIYVQPIVFDVKN